jgi:hypothetical protein
MEAEALRDGVRLALDMGRQNIVMETDALEVVNLWKESGTSRSIITSICQEIKELSGVFTSFDVQTCQYGSSFVC